MINQIMEDEVKDYKARLEQDALEVHRLETEKQRKKLELIGKLASTELSLPIAIDSGFNYYL